MVRRFGFISLLLALVLVIGSMLTPCNIVLAAGGTWILPTGHSDPNSTWSDEALAYDNDTSTYAMSSCVAYPDWGNFLELTHASINCSKIRFNAGHYAGGTDSVDVDAFYNSTWHNVYEGSFEGEAWIEASLGGTYAVTKARVRMHHDTSPFAKLYELNFYGVGTATITTNDATHVSYTTARLNSYLDNDGGEACDVRFQYGNETGNYTHATAWVNDTYTTGNSPYAGIAGLSGNTTYFFRAQAANLNGMVSGGESYFTTLLEVGAPSNLYAYPSSSQASLTWTKGSGSSRTKVVCKADVYPADPDDGEQVYFGTQSTCAHIDLEPGSTYYYRAWGEDAGNFSASYSNAIATTTAGAGPSDKPSAPPMPSRWFGAPDYTAMSGLPFYSIANSIADSYSIPRDNFWFVMVLLLITAMGLFIYSVSHNPTISILAVAVMIVLGAKQELLPLWFMFAFIVIAVGAIMVERRV